MEASASALNLYERQKTLIPDLPAQVGIVGVGGVGSWLALFLALAGVPELWLWDHDTVTDHNLNRLPLAQSAIGAPKTTALEAEILRMRPEARIYCFGTFNAEVFKTMDITHLEWLIAATDSLKSRRMVYDAAKATHVSYLEVAAEGEVGTVTDSPADFATPDEENPGYQSVPVWVGPCTMAASIASAHILHGYTPRDKTYRVGWNPDTIKVDMLCMEDPVIPVAPPIVPAPKSPRKYKRVHIG